ncbi:saccharopine dehydrogenase C-terminal domain-containing protein [Paraburkholderia diazotrophica]|uniref:Homospermidine synthase n=1 Tax=Paraburkholderia diazotrophica TaxID=667676 RepID=A0A1H6WB36_9BURK|nr:saccharopine dehydrogenase C-terminal domain-containing protein [Paraburkholderia diazotrophica]SEJ14251.1 homospermidine synthase [Paraburkholderia diazotrophica]
MEQASTLARLDGRLLIIGFGGMGHAMLPAIFRHIEVSAENVKVLCLPSDDVEPAKAYGVELVFEPLSHSNYESVLDRLIGEGDFVLNLSVGVASTTLVRFCWSRGIRYIDLAIEPWEDMSVDEAVPMQLRTNYALREELLALRLDRRGGPTAIVTQGANPGLASALVKQALINMARDSGFDPGKPVHHEEWAALARRLDIKVIHIAEQDTQVARIAKKMDEFVCTWSVDAFIEEGLQPAELGWGHHERHWPRDGARHGYGSDAAIYLRRPGFATTVRSWTPSGGPYHGFLITHGESISIADHLTVREAARVVYRPTVHYAYRPCPDSVLSIHELAGRNWHAQSHKRILRDEIVDGCDELGVLLMGNSNGAYWFGSRLSISTARQLMPYNSATTLQVVAGALAGMVWALRYPREGIVEPDDIDHETILAVAEPYLGEFAGTYGQWTPLRDRSALYEENVDASDPWQFLNFRVD